MNLMKDEKVLMEGDYKQVTLTTHRIRQENKSWGRIDLTSIMLEDVTSCEYSKKSKVIFLILGIILIVFAVLIGGQGRSSTNELTGALMLFGLALIFVYFFTIKRGLYISSPSAKIKLNTSGLKDENIKALIEKLESAKNDRYCNTRRSENY